MEPGHSAVPWLGRLADKSTLLFFAQTGILFATHNVVHDTKLFSSFSGQHRNFEVV